MHYLNETTIFPIRKMTSCLFSQMISMIICHYSQTSMAWSAQELIHSVCVNKREDSYMIF